MPNHTSERIKYIERRVWDFSRTPNLQNNGTYVDPLAKFSDFKKGSVSDLRFHQTGVLGPAFDNEVQEFTKRLRLHLSANNVNPDANPVDADSEVEKAARTKNDPMQNLLNTVANNYR